MYASRQLARAVARRPAAPPTRQFRSSRPAKGGGGGGPPPPTYLRTQAPKNRLHEEHELVWDDGVAAETCIDFDATHVSSGVGLQWWFGGFGFFCTLATLISFYSPKGCNKVTPRTGLIEPMDLMKGEE